MKKLLILAAALVLAAACNNGSKYTVRGTITGDSEALVNGKAYLFNQDRENPFRDTVDVINGKFEFKSMKLSVPAVLLDGREREEAMETYNRYQEDVENMKNALVAEAPVSHFALYLLSQEYMYLETDSLSGLMDAYKADPAFAENKYVAELDEYLQKELSLSVGNKAPDFTLNNPDGEPVTFSEFYKGNKVTMLDFWASWCGPCRNFNPTLVRIYNEYHKLGFDIIGVSLDRDKDSWIEGIKEDGLTWTQVSDLKFWQSEVGQLYNVSFIPQNVFVDAEGNIIGRKVAEEDIETLLDEYLK